MKTFYVLLILLWLKTKPTIYGFINLKGIDDFNCVTNDCNWVQTKEEISDAEFGIKTNFSNTKILGLATFSGGAYSDMLYCKN